MLMLMLMLISLGQFRFTWMFIENRLKKLKHAYIIDSHDDTQILMIIRTPSLPHIPIYLMSFGYEVYVIDIKQFLDPRLPVVKVDQGLESQKFIHRFLDTVPLGTNYSEGKFLDHYVDCGIESSLLTLILLNLCERHKIILSAGQYICFKQIKTSYLENSYDHPEKTLVLHQTTPYYYVRKPQYFKYKVSAQILRSMYRCEYDDFFDSKPLILRSTDSTDSTDLSEFSIFDLIFCHDQPTDLFQDLWINLSRKQFEQFLDIHRDQTNQTLDLKDKNHVIVLRYYTNPVRKATKMETYTCAPDYSHDQGINGSCATICNLMVRSVSQTFNPLNYLKYFNDFYSIKQ
jgi:hypothetical protein